jgi:hypothetical protein
MKRNPTVLEKDKVSIENKTVDSVPNHSNEKRPSSVKRRFESDLYQFIELDETKKSSKGFVAIPCTC